MFRRLSAALCAVMLLSACATLPASPPPPSEIADKTTLDENALLSLEVGYRAWTVAVSLLVDTGQLKGERAAQAKLVDARIYGALKIAEAAYRSANASSYSAALISARSALSEAMPLITGVGR